MWEDTVYLEISNTVYKWFLAFCYMKRSKKILNFYFNIQIKECLCVTECLESGGKPLNFLRTFESAGKKLNLEPLNF